MVFFGLTIDCHDPARLARFWAPALGWQPSPPAQPGTTWWAHYRHRHRDDKPEDAFHFVLMHDPEGNEFCLA